MTKEEIGAKLKAARISCGMTQREVADRIGRKQPIIGHWETGYSQPDANTLFTLCDIYETTVDDVFGFQKNNDITKLEYEHIKNYRNLDDFGRESVDVTLSRETERVAQLRTQKEYINFLEIEKQKTSEKLHSLRAYTYFGKIACAGSGFYFDDIPSEAIMAPDMGGDFIIGVNGDSMEPDYHDGDMLYVKKTEYMSYGDVGVFTIGNECFLKEYGENGLISRNENYGSIPGNEDVRLIGKVIGKVEED